MARAQGKTALGGYFDIVADFAFYGIFPTAFALQPGNALAAACLLCSFYINGASFLAYAAVAAGQGMETGAGREVALFLGRADGGAETIAFFLAFCLWPAWFSWMTGGFGPVPLDRSGPGAAGGAGLCKEKLRRGTHFLLALAAVGAAY